MGFFDDAAKKIGSAANEAGSKAKELASIAKLSTEIGSKEKDIEKMYTEIGKVVYAFFRDDVPDDVKDRIYKIDIAEEEIKALQQQIEELKGK